MTIRVGDLNRRVEFRVPVSIPDTANPGCSIPGWQTIGSRWAKLKPLSGREQMRAGKLTATSMMEVIIRFDSQIDEKAKLVWDGRQFNINGIDDLEERHFYMRILCEENVAQ